MSTTAPRQPEGNRQPSSTPKDERPLDDRLPDKVIDTEAKKARERAIRIFLRTHQATTQSPLPSDVTFNVIPLYETRFRVNAYKDALLTGETPVTRRQLIGSWFIHYHDHLGVTQIDGKRTQPQPVSADGV